MSIYERIAQRTGLAPDFIRQAKEQYAPWMSDEFLDNWGMTESGWNPKAVGPQTRYGQAIGMTQMLPETAAEMGVTDLSDPRQQFVGGLKYMTQGYDKYGTPEGAAAYYHGGPNEAIHGPKTRGYAAKLAGGTPNIELGLAPMIREEPDPYQDREDRLMAEILAEPTPMEQWMDAFSAGARTGPYSGNSGFLGGLQQGMANRSMRNIARNRAQLEAIRLREEIARNRRGEKPPSSYQEFSLAKQDGYGGTYTDFLKFKGESGATRVNVGTDGVRMLTPEEKTQFGLDPDQPFTLTDKGEVKPIKTSAFTEGNLAAAGFYDRMESADKIMRDLVDQEFDPTQMQEHFLDSVGKYGNFLKSSEGRRYRQAQEDWVRAKLRKESGAVIGDEEMDREIRTYFPMPGDEPAEIQQKRQSRETARRGFADMSGGKVEYKPIFITAEEIEEFKQMQQQENR